VGKKRENWGKAGTRGGGGGGKSSKHGTGKGKLTGEGWRGRNLLGLPRTSQNEGHLAGQEGGL